jgi:hypothetical protein
MSGFAAIAAGTSLKLTPRRLKTAAANKLRQSPKIDRDKPIRNL